MSAKLERLPLLGWTALALLVAALIARLPISLDRFLDQDELEHLNATYFITRGERIYDTFFENHPPLTYALLQPIVSASADAETIIVRSRLLMYALTVAILLVTAELARRVQGLALAALAALLLLSHVDFFQKSLEVRPDVPGSLSLLLAILSLVVGTTRLDRRWLCLGGALLTIAGFFTPKVVYASLGACVGVVLAWPARPRAGRWMAFGSIAAGAVVTAALLVGEMARRGMLVGFFNDCVKATLHMRIANPGARLTRVLLTSLRENPMMNALGLIGVGVLIARVYRTRASAPLIVLTSLATALMGLFHIPAPHRQNLLNLLPQLSIAAATGLLLLAQLAWQRWPRGLAVGATGVLLAACLGPPLRALWDQCPSREMQSFVLRRVLESTRPDERVFDAWTGLYLTRLPAYRYFYLNQDMQGLLDPGVLAASLSRALEDPLVKVAIRDLHFDGLPARVRDYILREFKPLLDCTPVLVRRTAEERR